MASIVDRAKAVAAVLQGDFSTCGKHIGHVVNDHDMYIQHVNDGDSDFEDSDSEDYDVCQSKSSKKIYEDMMRISEGDTLHTGVCTAKICAADTMMIHVAGEKVAIGDTETFENVVLPRGTSSAFGDILKQETRVDETVRVATEFTDFTWTHANGEEVHDPAAEFPAIKSAIEHISRRINDIGDVVLRKYKMNLYNAGGFFKEHIDHPRDAATTIGTLVILLPTTFEGGSLRLDHGREDDIHVRCSKTLQACAFLSTIPHEVFPVRSGCRVTLAYTIELVSRQQPPSIPTPLALRSHEASSIHKRLSEYYDEEMVGFLLSGRYTPEAVVKSGIECLTNDTDIGLATFIQESLGAPVQLISVACDFRSTNNAALEQKDTYRTAVYQLSLKRWDRLFTSTPEGGKEDNDDDDDFIEAHRINFFYNASCSDERELLKERVAAIPFAGNNSEPGSLRCIHLHTALVFEVPPFAAKRLQEEHSETPPAKKSRRDN